jgi:hypothetical protein
MAAQQEGLKLLIANLPQLYKTKQNEKSPGMLTQNALCKLHACMLEVLKTLFSIIGQFGTV